MLNNLFTRQSLIGYIIKIAGVVVMAWGLIQGIFSLVDDGANGRPVHE